MAADHVNLAARGCAGSRGPRVRDAAAQAAERQSVVEKQRSPLMLEDIVARLADLRASGAPQAQVEFLETLLLVYDHPLPDGSLESEMRLFEVFRDVAVVQRIVDMREELRCGIKFFAEEEGEAYAFEREDARRRLVEAGCLDAAAEEADPGTVPRAGHAAEASPGALAAATRYEVDDTSVTRFTPRERGARRATPEHLTAFFGKRYGWSYVESKSSSLLYTQKSSLVVVPLGLNATGLALIAAHNESSVFFVGDGRPVGAWVCGSAERIERLTRGKRVGLLVLGDAWFLIENKEETLVRLVARRFRTVAFMRRPTNVEDVARFLGIEDVLVFDDHAVDTEYVALPGTAAAGDACARLNEVVWAHCSRLPRPVLVVTHSSAETLSCAGFMLRKSLDNAPLEVKGEYPKELRNFLSHGIAVGECVAERADFYVAERGSRVRRRARSLVVRGTGGMGRNDMHRAVSEMLFRNSESLQRMVVVADAGSIDACMRPAPVQSRLAGTLREALVREIFEGPKSLSDVDAWFASTFLSLSHSADMRAVLLGLQRGGLVSYAGGIFAPTPRGCIAARHRVRLGDLDVLYTVGPHLTDSRLCELLGRVRPFDGAGDVPVPVDAGKGIQLMVAQKHAHEARALRLLAALFEVCIDRGLAGARLVLRHIKSIENKNFACLSRAPGDEDGIQIAEQSIQRAGGQRVLAVAIHARTFGRVHVFVSDVSDRDLLGYQALRVKSGAVEFRLPPRRFYNVFAVSDHEFWQEALLCIDAGAGT